MEEDKPDRLNHECCKQIMKSEDDKEESLKRYSSTSRRQIVAIIVIGIAVFIAAAWFDILEIIVAFSQRHEQYQVDEILTFIIVMFFALVAFSHRRWRETIELGEKLILRNRELREAMQQIKTLQGILPICCNCKKILDEKKEWRELEEYVHTHSDAVFSHGLCPDCAKKLYPRLHQTKES